METLPPVTLGATIFLAFLAAWLARIPLERIVVHQVPRTRQAARQFYLDLCLCVAAGTLVLIYNRSVYGFPLGSGLSMIIGCAVVGFFISLDTALARERTIIRHALAHDREHRPPQSLYSLTPPLFAGRLQQHLLPVGHHRHGDRARFCVAFQRGAECRGRFPG